MALESFDFIFSLATYCNQSITERNFKKHMKNHALRERQQQFNQIMAEMVRRNRPIIQKRQLVDKDAEMASGTSKQPNHLDDLKDTSDVYSMNIGQDGDDEKA